MLGCCHKDRTARHPKVLRCEEIIPLAIIPTGTYITAAFYTCDSIFYSLYRDTNLLLNAYAGNQPSTVENTQTQEQIYLDLEEKYDFPSYIHFIIPNGLSTDQHRQAMHLVLKTLETHSAKTTTYEQIRDSYNPSTSQYISTELEDILTPAGT